MIKSEVVTNARVDAGYPKLMRNADGDIALFQHPSAGIIVFAYSGANALGDYDDSFDMKYWSDFDGKLTLSNGSE